MLDVPIALLYSDNQRIIIIKAKTEGALLREDDIIPYFLLVNFRGAMGYYICHEHRPCVFRLRRSRVTSTGETSDDGVYVIHYDFVSHLQCEDGWS